MSFFSHITLIRVREIHPARLFHPARLLDTQEYIRKKVSLENKDQNKLEDSVSIPGNPDPESRDSGLVFQSRIPGLKEVKSRDLEAVIFAIFRHFE